TTIHLRQSGWNETKHYHGFWDWCGPVQEFRVFEEMTSAWRNKYVRTSNLPPGTPAEEHFYVQVYTTDPANPSSASACWIGLIYNWNAGQWENKRPVISLPARGSYQAIAVRQSL